MRSFSYKIILSVIVSFQQIIFCQVTDTWEMLKNDSLCVTFMYPPYYNLSYDHNKSNTDVISVLLHYMYYDTITGNSGSPETIILEIPSSINILVSSLEFEQMTKDYLKSEDKWFYQSTDDESDLSEVYVSNFDGWLCLSSYAKHIRIYKKDEGGCWSPDGERAVNLYYKKIDNKNVYIFSEGYHEDSDGDILKRLCMSIKVIH